MATRTFAVSAIGRDRPGIVASVAGVLLEHGLNIADSQMTILGGHFAMTLLVSAPEAAEVEDLRASLERARRELGLEAATLNEVADEPHEAAVPSHTVTVYGVDHPGIVHAVTTLLADRGVNITDLTTRLVGGDREPIYAMMMEVALPDASISEPLAEALAVVAGEQGVEVVLRPLEHDAL